METQERQETEETTERLEAGNLRQALAEVARVGSLFLLPAFICAQQLPSDAHQPSSRWIGTWTQGENRITVIACWPYAPAVLTFDAKAYWHSPSKNVETAQIYVRAHPFGNRGQLADEVCKIDLTLMGNYLLASDNNLCGGINVRFRGLWKRSTASTPSVCD